MRIAKLILWAVLVAVLTGLPTQVLGQLIRKPVWAGQFYPADKNALEAQIRALAQKAGPGAAPADRPLKALVLPHAGYVYSGPTAAQGAAVLAGRRFAKVVLLGPDHRVGFADAAVTGAMAWETPLGLVPIHGDAKKLVDSDRRFNVVAASEAAEHSLEVIVPFLQYHLGRFALVPITLGPTDPAAMAATVAGLLASDSLLVVSSDLSHYLPDDQARQRDQQTLKAVLALDPALLVKNDNRACGAVPLMILIELARRQGWRPQLLHYATSADSAGGRDKVVGYAAIAFWEEVTMSKDSQTPTLTTDQGQALVKLARRTLAEALGRTPPADALLDKALQDKGLDQKRGTFVTLTKKGDLRGCIGSLSADEALVAGVRHNAKNAAFHDPRFAPLGAAELDEVAIEVSILTDPQPLDYKDAADLVAKLRPKIDGVILRKAGAGATFLPQVWDQLPRTEDFLGHLCRKAGLAPDAWRKGDLTVLTYQVQYFHE